MKIANTSTAPLPSFKRLVLSNEAPFSTQQQYLIEDLANLANQVYKEDKKQRSHLKFLEESCNLDMFVKHGVKKDSIAVYTVDRTCEEAEFVMQCSKEKPPKAQDLVTISVIAQDKKEEENTNFLLSFVAGIVIITGMFLLGKPSSNSEKLSNTVKKEIFQAPTKSSLKDSLLLFKNFIK